MTWARLLPSSRGWDGPLFGRFRLLLGAYLFVHFAHLVPWAAELFSSAGVLPEARLSPLSRLFPNVLALQDGPVFVTVLVAGTALASAALALGAAARPCAIGLFYVLACLYGRNPLIANPSLPYVGWLLLALAFMPPLPMGVGLWRPGERSWSFPGGIFVAAWVLLAAGYSFSGYTKLASPSWLDGTAVARVLESPLSRPGFLREALLALPSAALRSLGYSALLLELLFLPLAMIPSLRRWLWLALGGMHLGLVALIDFADLSVGMLLFHLFVADPRWVPARSAT